MANYLNDGSLIGFWPFNEASGAPLFLNHSPARSQHPSGLSFDMQVSTANALNISHAIIKSNWPGTSTIFDVVSGITYRGYMPQGTWRISPFTADASPRSHYLIMGNGSTTTREQTASPNVAQSGFTAGIWVYPNSDGNFNMTNISTASFTWETDASHSHVLMGQYLYTTAAAVNGWKLGVSGQLSGGAQFSSTLLGGPRQLAAFVTCERATNPTNSIRTPIESGRFTHLTFTYRFINGTGSDELVLYKDGKVAASGLVAGTNNLTLANSNMISRPLTIGGTDASTTLGAGTNNYTGTAGWNHLVSGAYFFRRVLSEGEVLDLHNNGGMQPRPNTLLASKQLSLTDVNLLAHYPFRAAGYADITKNHNVAIMSQDEGQTSAQILAPGPFKGGAIFQTGAAASDALIMNSGLMNSMLAGQGWTIAAWAAPINGAGRAKNMIFSIGSVSDATALTNVGANTAPSGITLTEFALSPVVNRMRLSVYTLDSITVPSYHIDIPNSGFINGTASHYAVAYDDSTKGLAVYFNGAQVSSGVLPNSLNSQLIRLAGSGFPLLFGNGILTIPSTSAGHGMHATGGQGLWIGPITIVGRALLPQEVNYLATSGITATELQRTPYDPRLMGYWPCSDYKMDDIIAEDKARVWENFPGHLLRGDTAAKWERVWGTAFNTVIRTNLYATRTITDNLQASYGNLGITSGIFGVHGISPGTANVADASEARSAIANLSARYKPINSDCDGENSQNLFGEYVLGFEVTPSGTIPSTFLGMTSDTTKFEFNSCLHVYGNMGNSSTSLGEVRSFLTTIDAPAGSGVSIVFVSRNGAFSAANITTITSGTLPFGVPSKVLLHTKFNDPYSITAITAGQVLMTATLWINGQKIQSRTLPAATFHTWSTQSPNSTNDDWVLQFGGEAGNDVMTTFIDRDGGLGNIYLREIFVMRGVFDTDEVQALATSGIQYPSITGYTDTIPKTQVRNIDSGLEGYWRFNGFGGGGSGTTDFGIKSHDLRPFAEQQNRNSNFSLASMGLHFIPGPLQNSDLGFQCSGITYGEPAASFGATVIPPFAVSGVGFDSPQNGFSVGFLLAKKDVTTATRIDAILTYGLLGSNATNSTTVNLDRGWAIVADQNTSIKMVMSVGGNMYFDNTANAAQSGQLVCGTHNANAIFDDLRRFDNYKWGNPLPPRVDLWSHYCWVYDNSIKQLICYVNGNEVDRKDLKIDVNPYTGGLSALGPAIPANPAARMITFLAHQNNAPWQFTSPAIFDKTSILTDTFYFSRPLTNPEVRYIAFNGIDGVTGTTVSGIIGGYLLGSEVCSGIIGGYTKGRDTGSGIIGGYNVAAIQSSGIVGGYVSGIVFTTTASGIIGGYITGSIVGSGLIGGYIRGLGQASGIIGGFVIGGLQGQMQFDGGFTIQALSAKDFDSQLQVAKTANSDFDAKVVVFQAETPPVVDIIIPGTNLTGVSAPFNQYFVGGASGTQGKSIVQTKWTFADLTPTVSVAQSGIGLYPIQHRFAQSGIYAVRFEAIDSNGIHASAIRIINAANGISPVNISLSGVPRAGPTGLVVDFTTVVETLPSNVAINTSLLYFDDGQSTTSLNPSHSYNNPGSMRPVWVVRDSRGVIWSDTLNSGSDN